MKRKTTKFKICLYKIAVNDHDFDVEQVEEKFDSWSDAKRYIKKERVKNNWRYIDIRPIM